MYHFRVTIFAAGAGFLDLLPVSPYIWSTPPAVVSAFLYCHRLRYLDEYHLQFNFILA
jgi:hypothetical protein